MPKARHDESEESCFAIGTFFVLIEQPQVDVVFQPKMDADIPISDQFFEVAWICKLCNTDTAHSIKRIITIRIFSIVSQPRRNNRTFHEVEPSKVRENPIERYASNMHKLHEVAFVCKPFSE